MTEEELREKIAKLLFGNIWKWEICMEVSDKILILIHEAGWRSPEEVDKMVEHRIYEMYANETYQP